MIGVHYCLRCKNFIEGDEHNADTWKCKAFPDGIPYERYAFMNVFNRLHCNNGIGHEEKVEENPEYIFPKN
ncbi:MAG: glutamyl-tRNA amidotransferase [Ruminococcus sp.]|nr:glutamyl-tRNA amidotransferase [Ruminococcus sp.]